MVQIEDSGGSSYGALLGDYFMVVRTIEDMESEFDESRLEGNVIYHRLLDAREDLRERLDEVADSHVDSRIKRTLDEAFSDLWEE